MAQWYLVAVAAAVTAVSLLAALSATVCNVAACQLTYGMYVCVAYVTIDVKSSDVIWR